MRIVQNEMLINVHVAGRSREFNNTKEGFSSAVQWASEVAMYLLMSALLVLAMAAAEAL